MTLTKENVDLYELLCHEGGSLLYEGAEGCVVREQSHGSVLTDILDGAALCRVLQSLELPDFWQITVKSTDARRAVGEAFGFTGENPCSQWTYVSERPPMQTPHDIRPLTPEYAQQAAAHYHLVDNSLSYLHKRIAAGRMWGLFEDGSLAGFIGIHSEGAIGMLEILPEYRRKGYGYALEAFLIDWHLQRGWHPYCHVVDGNEASLHLQKRLGMEQAALPAIWAWKE